MLDLLFYIFSAIMLVSAVLMVVMPNAVNGAMCMIISFLSTAVLFVLLESYFLAIIQVLVYAGAVMVLFLFIIMLLDAEKEGGIIEYRHKLSVGAALFGFALFVILLCSLITSGDLPEPAWKPVLENPAAFDEGVPYTTSSKSFGYSLFTKYMLPFQVTGFLLLSAMIGVIVVSKRPKELEG